MGQLFTFSVRLKGWKVRLTDFALLAAQTGIEVASLLLGASVRFFANARQSRKRVEREV